MLLFRRLSCVCGVWTPAPAWNLYTVMSNRADDRADLDIGLEHPWQEMTWADWPFRANRIPLSIKRIIVYVVLRADLLVFRKRECLLKAFDGLCWLSVAVRARLLLSFTLFKSKRYRLN